MMPVRKYVSIVSWISLFPLLVILGNAFIFYESFWSLLKIQAFPWLNTLFKYIAGYGLITIGIVFLSKIIDKRNIFQTVKDLGCPRNPVEGIVSFLTGSIVGILSFFIVIGSVIYLLAIYSLSISFGALSGSLIVLLVAPPEELARCYVQKKIFRSLSGQKMSIFRNIFGMVFITLAFGFAHEVARLLSNIFTSGPLYLFSFQDISWYIGGVILAILYQIRKSWVSNSVAHGWYNILTILI
jgi:hypothetical protein